MTELPQKRWAPVPAEKIDAARRLFEAGGVSQSEIARQVGIDRATVKRFAERGGWIAPTDDRAALVGRIRRRIDAEIVEAERALSVGGAKSSDAAERSARTLASLVRTLRELEKFDEERRRVGRGAADETLGEGHDDVVPDLDELRRTLAERLDRLRREHEA